MTYVVIKLLGTFDLTTLFQRQIGATAGFEPSHTFLSAVVLTSWGSRRNCEICANPVSKASSLSVSSFRGPLDPAQVRGSCA
jgi:hypothetical protein